MGTVEINVSKNETLQVYFWKRLETNPGNVSFPTRETRLFIGVLKDNWKRHWKRLWGILEINVETL